MNKNRWYWRANDANHIMIIGHGTAETRNGMVEQVAAMLNHSPNIGASIDGKGIELIIQPPERVRE